jgi:hypothetical protein
LILKIAAGTIWLDCPASGGYRAVLLALLGFSH